MSAELLKKVEQKFMGKKLPDVKTGQTVEVSTIIRDGDKQRIQKFKGLVIAVKGSGTSKMFIVRKISYGVGVEKTFPLYSTNIDSIKILKMEPVRRSKLYFMRDRVGKKALRVRKGRTVLVPQEGEAEEVVEPITVENTEVIENVEEVKQENN